MAHRALAHLADALFGFWFGSFTRWIALLLLLPACARATGFACFFLGSLFWLVRCLLRQHTLPIILAGSHYMVDSSLVLQWFLDLYLQLFFCVVYYHFTTNLGERGRKKKPQRTLLL